MQNTSSVSAPVGFNAYSNTFPVFAPDSSAVPILIATPDLPGSIHRYYDTSPISPSGRYLAVTRMPHEDRCVEPGDEAEVILIDLCTGEHRTIATTRGWDSQTGAHVQWGVTDHELFYNDLDPADWTPFAVVYDPLAETTRRLSGSVYMLTPDGSLAASPCLRSIAQSMPGYGVVVPEEAVPDAGPIPETLGVTVTPTDGGPTRLVASVAELLRRAQPRINVGEYTDGAFHAALVKWSPDGNRIMVVLRWKKRGAVIRRTWRQRAVGLLLRKPSRKRARWVLTMDPDGQDVRIAVPNEQWRYGGHHPNWCPDSERIIMNQRPGGGAIRLVEINARTAEWRVMTKDAPGSGHPTLHPDGRHVLADAYPKERISKGDGSSPIRWIDIEGGSETRICDVPATPNFPGPENEMRVDPHPAWDRTYRVIAFNGLWNGARAVFLADMSSLIDGAARTSRPNR